MGLIEIHPDYGPVQNAMQLAGERYIWCYYPGLTWRPHAHGARTAAGRIHLCAATLHLFIDIVDVLVARGVPDIIWLPFSRACKNASSTGQLG